MQSNGRLQDWQATTDRFPSRKQPATGAPASGTCDETAPSLPLSRTSLDSLTAALGRVVQETMQPEQVSVWLKSTIDDRRQTAKG